MTSVAAAQIANPGSPNLTHSVSTHSDSTHSDSTRPDAARSDLSPSEFTAMPESQGVALVLAILGAIAFISRRRNRD